MQSFEQIMGDLKKGQYKPIYFLMGDEPYFIDIITNYIEKNLLKEDEKAFNQTIVYGADANINQLVEVARQYPMMAEHSLIIIKEAQNLKGIDGGSDADSDSFLKYVENPVSTTVMVINYKGKKLDSRRKITKALDKSHVLFESKPLYDNQVGGWIVNYLKQQNLTIDPKLAEVIAMQLGNKLSTVSMELDKLKVAIGGATTITAADVERNVGISKDFNVFELQNAIGMRDVYKSAMIAKHLGAMAKHSIIPDIASLYGYFTKIMIVHSMSRSPQNEVAAALKVSPFFVKDYYAAARCYTMTQCANVIGILREYDAYSKGIDAPQINDADLLREMVFKIVMIQ